MKPTRAAGILLKGDTVLLMHRVKNDSEYYTFPGGSVESWESLREAVKRELFEETTIKVKVARKVYVHDYGSSEGHYFLCRYVKGEPKLGDCIEKERMNNTKGVYYNPVWVNIKNLKDMLVYPLEIRDWLIADLQTGFSEKVKVEKLNTLDLRQTI